MNAHSRAPAGLHVASARLPDEGELPSLDGSTGWLNSPPLTPAGLRAKVILAGFWTYTCTNWLRQLPYLRAWAGKYSGHGLVVIGVHTPEFSFEHNASYGKASITGEAAHAQKWIFCVRPLRQSAQSSATQIRQLV